MQFSLNQLAAVTFLAVTADSTLAAEFIERPAQSIVRSSDLDLSRPEAVRTLYTRIQAAAHRVCKAEVTYHYLQASRARHECHRLTVTDAVVRANLAMLTDLHRDASSDARSGARLP